MSPNFHNAGLNVVICKGCGTIRTNPYFSNDDLVDFYTTHYRELHEATSTPEQRFQVSLSNSIFTGNSTYTFLNLLWTRIRAYIKKKK